MKAMSKNAKHWQIHNQHVNGVMAIYTHERWTRISIVNQHTHTHRSVGVSHRLLAITLVVIDYELIHINSDHPSKYTFERAGSTIRSKDCKQLPHLSHSSAVLPFELTKLAFCFCETQLNLTLFKKQQSQQRTQGEIQL